MLCPARGAVMDERSLRYEGWRVALAAGTGVLFASFFFMSFAVFVKPLNGSPVAAIV